MDKYAIVTIGKSHFIMPVKNCCHHRGDDISSIILEDNTRLEIGTNNLIMVYGESDLMNAILESSSEKFYKAQKDKQGKAKIKKIANDNKFKIIEGGKNE